jgi:hypothetical protein
VELVVLLWIPQVHQKEIRLNAHWKLLSPNCH